MREHTLLRYGILAGFLLLLLVTLPLADVWMSASAQGTRIEYGENIDDEITTAGDQDSWLFEGVEGDVITIQVTRTSGDLIPSVVLLGPDEVLLVDLSWPEQGAPVARFSASLRLEGTHTIIVSGHNNTSGMYTLSLTLDESGITPDVDRGVIAYGQTVTGEISTDSFNDLWSFRGTRGDIIDVQMAAASGDLDPFVSIIIPQGDVLITSDTGGEGKNAALYSVTLPETGVYTLVARRAGSDLGAGGDTQGAYELKLTLRRPGLDTIAVPPIVVDLGTDVSGRLTANAPFALYSLNVDAGVVSIGLALSTETQLGSVSVMTPDRVEIAAFAGLSMMRSGVLLADSGTIWVQVSAENVQESEPVDFVLNVDRLAIAARPSKALLYNRSRRVVPVLLEEQQAWHFAGRAGEIIDLSVRPVETVTSGNVTIFAPDGTLLLSRSAQNGFVQSLVLESNGVYEVFVDPGVALMGYTIAVERSGVSGLAYDQRAVPLMRGALSPDTENIVSGSLVASGSDLWTLDINEPQKWAFEFQETSTDAPVSIVIESPEGEPLALSISGRQTGASIDSVRLTSPGRYRVIVFDPTGFSQSDYVLRASPVTRGELVTGIAYKSRLTAERDGDVWGIDLPPDALLNLELETLTDSGMPSVHVIGPDGLEVIASEQHNTSGKQEMLGISSAEGGRFFVVVAQPGLVDFSLYRLLADVIMPFGSDTVDGTEIDFPGGEIFVSTQTPAPGQDRVVIADEITPLIRPDTSILQSAGRIEPEVLVRGEVSSDTLYQAWSFQASAGQALAFSVVALDVDQPGPDIVLVDETGRVVAEDLQRNGSTAYLLHRFTGGGTFYALVKPGEHGRYTLWMDSVSGLDETLPSVLPGQVLGYGDTRAGELIEASDIARYAFYGYVDDIVFVRVSRTQGDLNPQVVLADQDGNILSEGVPTGDGSNSGIDAAVLPQDGVYQLLVQSSDPENAISGRFRLHLNLKQAGLSTERNSGVLGDKPTIASLTPAQPTQRWLFSAAAGEQVTVRVEPLSPGVPTPFQLLLTDTAGNIFLEKEANIGQAGLEFHDVLLPRGGVYQAVVVGGSRQAGQYRISLERDSSRIVDNEAAIQYGQTEGKVLTSENFLDVWSFAGSQGDTVSIAVRPVRGDPALISFQVRTSDGRVVTTSVDDEAGYGARVDNLVLPQDGHYVIVVGNVDGSFEGQTAYELTVNLNDTPARSMGSVLSYGQAVKGTFHVDDAVDTWLFEGQQGDVISVTATGNLPAVTPLISLISTDWHYASVSGQTQILLQAESVNGGPAQFSEFKLPASGSYALVVENPSLAGGEYMLELVAQTAVSRAVKSLSSERVQEGLISSTKPEDYWTFDGVRGAAVTLTATPDARSTLAPALKLVSQGGTILAIAEASPGEPAVIDTVHLPSDGAYQVIATRALGADGITEGTYALELQQAPPPDSGPRSGTQYGQLERGGVNDDGFSETWSFSGLSGDVVQVTVETTSGNLDPAAKLYAPDGTVIASGDDEVGLNTRFSASLPVDGDYTVEVMRFGGALDPTEGNYALLVDRLYHFELSTPQFIISYGERAAGTVDAENSTDVWQFMGFAGDTIRAKIQFPLDDAPLSLGLADPVGNVLTTSTRDRGDAVIDGFVLPVSGTYSLQVQRPADARAEDFSPYALDLGLLGLPDTPVSAQGGVLVPDQSVAGRFIQAPATHVWVFRGRAEQEVLLAFDQLSGNLNLFATLLAPDGTVLFSSTFPRGAHDSLAGEVVKLPENGLYQVLIGADRENLGAEYRFALKTTEAAADVAQVLSPFEAGFGSITVTRPVEYWDMQVAAGETLSLRAGVVSGNLEPRLVIWGPDAQPLARSMLEFTPFGVQASLTDFVAPVEGVYRVSIERAGGITGSTTGTYRILLRRHRISSYAAAAQDIAYGQQVFGLMQAAAPEIFAFQGNAGDFFTLSVRVTPGSEVPEMVAEKETGEPLSVPITVTETEASIPVLALPENGRYVVVLRSEHVSEYTFTVIRRESAVPPGSRTRVLVSGQELVDAIDSPDEINYWAVSGSAGDVLVFAVDTSAGRLQADVSLYGPGGFMQSAVEQPGNRVTMLGPIRLPSSGDYVLRVGAWLGGMGNTAGEYAIRVDPAQPGVSGSDGGHVVAYGVPVTGGLIAGDAQDIWTFDGRAGEVVTIQAEQIAGSGSLSVELNDTDAAALASGQVSPTYQGAEITSVTLPKTGSYTLIVSGSVAEQANVEYRLTIIREQSPIIHSIETAQGVVFGQTQTAVLEPGQQYQAWVFYGRAGEQISGQVEVTSGNRLGVVYLVGPDSRVLFAVNALTSPETLELPGYVLADTGLYAVVVGGAEGAPVSVEYRLALNRVSAGAVSQGTLYDQADGEISTTATAHEWSFVPEFSGDYRVEALSFSPSKCFNLYVLSPENTVLSTGERSDSCAAATARFERGQRYRLVVSGGPAAVTGAYRIQVYPAAVVTSGGIVASNMPNVGQLSNAHFTDEWRAVGASGTLQVDVGRTTGDLVPAVMVFDQSGSLLTEGVSAGDGVVTLNVELPSQGDYIIVVSRADSGVGKTTGNYAVAVNFG